MEEKSGVRGNLTLPAAEPEAVEKDILINKEGCAGVVTLNRAASLNALTPAMRAAIADAFTAWGGDPIVYAAVIQSAGGRAFCAGGDIKETTKVGRTCKGEAAKAFAAEYKLSWLLDCFGKPTVSLIDGIVMGSGVGISLYGTHRVAGERYRFAMPETAIGLFPDDGVCWAFARMPHEFGMYLALTGRAIGRADAYRLGLVTHCIPASRFPEVMAGLSAADPVDPLLDDRHEDPGTGELDAIQDPVARCFGGETVEDIFARLRAERGRHATWAEGVLKELQTRSPTSLKITHRHVRTARSLDLSATLQQDFRLGCRCLENHDFYEGVRAMLIDRDKAPRWQPARLEDVSTAMVDGYFSPLDAGELDLPTRAAMQAVAR